MKIQDPWSAQILHIFFFKNRQGNDENKTKMLQKSNRRKKKKQKTKNKNTKIGQVSGVHFTWVPPPKPSLRPFVLRVGTIKIGYRAEQNPARRTIVLTIVRKNVDDEKREDNCLSFWVWELKALCNERLVEAVL